MNFDNEKNDGSDIFWPGYVDAVTNLVLNLLFLLTIMTVAVFMFALELGRASLGGAGKTPLDTIKAEATPKSAADSIKEREAAVAALKKQVTSLNSTTPVDAESLRKKVDEINSALNREIQFLNTMKIQQAKAGAPVTVVPATEAIPKPPKGLDRILTTEAEVIVQFIDEAVKLTKAEHVQLRDALKTLSINKGVRIFVEVPTGFTEAKRMGFYRAMEVRNELIEMKVPAEQIDVSVREGKSRANASHVHVTPK